MSGSILIGLDESEHCAVLTELGVRWAQRTGATLVGLGIVDEPSIRAIEPAWAVGGTPGKDPVYYMGYEPRLADVNQQVGKTPGSIRGALRRGRSGPRRTKTGWLALRSDRGRVAVL